MNLYSVLRKPTLTEKSNELREKDDKYTFLVNPQTNKDEIKKAIKKVFDVDVASVNVSVRRGKIKRRGMNVGLQAKTKRAVVTLKKGQKIKIFEDR